MGVAIVDNVRGRETKLIKKLIPTCSPPMFVIHRAPEK